MQPELPLAFKNTTPPTISTFHKDHYDRGRPKSWAKMNPTDILKESLCGHLKGMACRTRELYVCLYQMMGMVAVVNEDALESVRPEHGIDGIE